MNTRIPKALPQWAELVELIAPTFGLDRSLLLAIIWQESSGDPEAVRAEPGFVWFFSPERGPLRDPRLTTEHNRDKALTILGEEEFNFQTCSHGMMQVMGSVAREMGFIGPKQDLYLPEINVEYGCKYLKACIRRAGGNLQRGLLRWNGGGRNKYPDEVMEKYDILKGLEV